MLGSLGAPASRPRRRRYRAVGQYFAPQAMQPRVLQFDTRMEWTPEGREARQMYEKGFASFMAHARGQRLPERGRAGLPAPFPRGGPVHGLGQFERDPHLVAYQERMYEMMPRYPGAAAELAHQAAMVGRQADLRAGRHMMLKLRRPAAGLGRVWMMPSAPPGYSYQERAMIGMPTRLTRYDDPVLHML